LIEKVSKVELEQSIKDTYKVGKREVLNHHQPSRYFNLEERNRTFCIHQECNHDWVQLEYGLENLYEFDELIRQLTFKKNSKAIIGYKQTTSGEARFAFFQAGQMKRSIVQKYVSHQSEYRTIENFGKKLSFEKKTINSTSMKPMEGVKELLDFYDEIQPWIGKLGFIFNGRKEEENEFIHLEIINYKN
jgi:hypothetical protein